MADDTETVTLALSSAQPTPRSMKQHLIMAIYNWCNEEGYVPHVLVDTSIRPERVFPIRQMAKHIHENKIVFNVRPSAAIEFSITKEDMSFRARFAGTQVLVGFSLDSVIGVFAAETRVGFFFSNPNPPAEEVAEPDAPLETQDQLPTTPPKKGKPTLTIVK